MQFESRDGEGCYFARQEPCDECGGSGEGRYCSTCNGAGHVLVELEGIEAFDAATRLGLDTSACTVMTPADRVAATYRAARSALADAAAWARNYRHAAHVMPQVLGHLVEAAELRDRARAMRGAA